MLLGLGVLKSFRVISFHLTNHERLTLSFPGGLKANPCNIFLVRLTFTGVIFLSGRAC